MQEGSLAVTFNKNDIWKFGTLTITPLDWLEASYFYYRPSDLVWESNSRAGHYLDKGFNVKFLYEPKNNIYPNIALGLDDFAGTGFFTREYIVATQNLQKMNITLGLGWGKFVGESSFKNPFSYISETFNSRPEISKNLSLGGEPSYDQWFKGRSTLFGGIEYFIPRANGLKLKVEYDPYNYFDFSAINLDSASFKRRNKDSEINFGLSYPINKNFTVDFSYIKGNTANFSFVYRYTFNKNSVEKPAFNPEISKANSGNTKDAFYRDLLFNLNKNNLLLQTATLNKNNLDVAISTSNHRNAVRSSSYAAIISKEVADLNDVNLSKINISHINTGIELNNITYVANQLNKNSSLPVEIIKSYTSIDSGNKNSYKAHDFQPEVAFPVIFSSISPTLVNHVGNPEKFYYGGVDLQYISEIQFRRNLILSSELNYSLYNNFQDTVSGPGSDMQHVRTDIVDYLKASTLYLKRMQLDYIFTPYKDVYAKISGGIFETMYGGIGGEMLYKPFSKNFSFGLDIFYVRQRGFDQKFSFKEYDTLTGHLSFAYHLPLGIEANISYGKYLAKDVGYTFDLSRRTPSGFKAGIYFTRTDVSAELFGEGSFDKGFYFQIPIDLFSNEYKGNYTSFKLSPLTRDGGAKLQYEKDLRGLIYNSTYYELSKQWDGYAD